MASCTKQDEFRHITIIESDSASVRSAILTNLKPHDVSFVFKTPRLQRAKTPTEESVGAPEVQMRLFSSNFRDRQGADLFDCHGLVSMEPFMLGSHFAGAIGK